MNIKSMIKKILCPLQCARFHIINSAGHIYIGKACKIVNGKNMAFGENVSIMPYTMLVSHNDSQITFGNGVEIGMYSRVASLSKIEIGQNVFTGPHVFIADYNHEYRETEKPIKAQGDMVKSTQEFPSGGVRIGGDTWIGTNVVIAGTMKIGKHCVIGANSVVTGDIPDYCVAAGIPCKVIKKYNFESGIWEKV